MGGMVEVVGVGKRVDGANLHYHLLACQQSVGDELACADGDLGVSHDCGGLRRLNGEWLLSQ